MKNKMRPIHPGEILKEEFMAPLDLSANALAKALSVPANRITAILNETRGITGDTALRFAEYFNTTPDFWMNLQSSYEIRKAEEHLSSKILDHIRKLRPVTDCDTAFA